MLTGDNTLSTVELLDALRDIVGGRHLLTSERTTRRYRTGYRFGAGGVLAVVRPGSLIEQWRVVKACVQAGAIVIMQAANTGLTGGSTPRSEGYDRPVVMISTRRLKGVRLIDGGRQVLCFPGATLYELERLLGPLGREPHSVIGSSCIGASVVGGICNNSGGALVRRGPAFTQLALFARVDEAGQLALVNHLGMDLGHDPETILTRLERGDYTDGDIRHDPALCASASDYEDRVRAVDEGDPVRFNADPARLYEASGSAGRVIVFAVRLDSFEADHGGGTFYIGTNDPADLTRIRRDILSGFVHLPISGEYIHRGAFDMAALYGKDTFLAIERLGTERLPMLFAVKAWIDDLASRVGLRRASLSDRLLQFATRLFPQHLPARMRDFRDRFEHHLILKVSGEGLDEARAYLAQLPRASADVFECSPEEARKAFLHRFAVAGAAVRYRAIHTRTVEDIIAIDVALPRNADTWVEVLPPDLEARIVRKIYYGHFFCHVFHQDYAAAKGVDPHRLEEAILRTLDARGAEYPAEHNVGHLYAAKPALARFYRELDPGNRFNPGIGKTSAWADWADGEKPGTDTAP
ncbi:D-lactate dehydrogenase [Sphingosinicella xenopeptidilytica]|uniref:Quinone-dependent D-lactate dehydrogenase n=1 Tax=Sphingosinicella xenopeptidilytica TaxID=364098 RepID=A0ABW3C599_SPHXN